MVVVGWGKASATVRAACCCAAAKHEGPWHAMHGEQLLQRSGDVTRRSQRIMRSF